MTTTTPQRPAAAARPPATAARLVVLAAVLRSQRLSLLLWGVALMALTTLYVGFYPVMVGPDLESVVESMPEDLVTAMGYDQIGTAGGWLTGTVYGLVGPVLLLVHAIGTGAGVVAGREEDGTLELEITAPVSRRRVALERLAALWLAVLVLVAAVTATTLVLVAAMALDVAVAGVLAGSTGLALLVLGFGTVALAVGAATGRRAAALGVAAALAVAAFVLDALGPVVEAAWMTAVSPFSWYLAGDPLTEGVDLPRLLLLAALPVVAALAAVTAFERRDLVV